MTFYWLIQSVFHIDVYLQTLIETYGSLSYALLFLVIFIETGLVIMPFLPGDSLLFVAGTFAATGAFNVELLILVCTASAILGDTVNYYIGSHGGTKILGKFIKKENLEKTQKFFDTHGKKTIILARFVPIIRTLAPFVAGVGKMNYSNFIKYNIIGGIVWVVGFVLAGYFFGSIPIIKDNLTHVILGIVAVSILPGIWHYVRSKMKGTTTTHS